jgi:ABC-type Fe3+/spermidine/putrescine transport system ATPase subunit
MSVLLVELCGVSKQYGGRDALRDVSIAIPPGRHTVLIGPSGSGKSTALRLVAGLESPDGGSILLSGVSASEASGVRIPPHRRGLAMVFQDLALWPNLSALDNVVLGLSGAGLSRADARARAVDALALCRVDRLANARPGRLSGGEQQRVALARALAIRPALLLLDEPFGSLDPLTKGPLIQDVAELAAARGSTLLLVTHDPLEAVALCPFGVVLGDGRVEESGPLADLFRAPRSPLLQAFQARLRAAGGVDAGGR